MIRDQLGDQPLRGLPNRRHSAPASSMVATAPADRPSSASPRAAEEAPVCSLMAGTRTGLINVLNPDRILLGGLLAADPERLRAAVAARSPWGRGSIVPVLGCALDNGSLIGAAELAWQPILDDPGLLDISDYQAW